MLALRAIRSRVALLHRRNISTGHVDRQHQPTFLFHLVVGGVVAYRRSATARRVVALGALPEAQWMRQLDLSNSRKWPMRVVTLKEHFTAPALARRVDPGATAAASGLERPRRARIRSRSSPRSASSACSSEDEAYRIGIMYAGRIVRVGPVRDVSRSPRHPYTIGLLSTRAHGGRLTGRRLPAIPGRPPHLANLPPSCAFAPCCALADDVSDDGARSSHPRAGASRALPPHRYDGDGLAALVPIATHGT